MSNWQQLTKKILVAIDDLKNRLQGQSSEISQIRDVNEQLKLQFSKLEAVYSQLKVDSASQIVKLTANNAAILKELAVTAEQKVRADQAIAEVARQSEAFHAQVAEQDRVQEAAIAEFKELSSKQADQIQSFLAENNEQMDALQRIAQALDIDSKDDDSVEDPEKSEKRRFEA